VQSESVLSILTFKPSTATLPTVFRIAFKRPGETKNFLPRLFAVARWAFGEHLAAAFLNFGSTLNQATSQQVTNHSNFTQMHAYYNPNGQFLPCLLPPKIFQDFSSHQIFRRMYGVLNIDKNKN
jgi:hypothetical protein